MKGAIMEIDGKLIHMTIRLSYKILLGEVGAWFDTFLDQQEGDS